MHTKMRGSLNQSLHEQHTSEADPRVVSQESGITRGKLAEGMLVEVRLRLEPFIRKLETIKSN